MIKLCASQQDVDKCMDMLGKIDEYLSKREQSVCEGMTLERKALILTKIAEALDGYKEKPAILIHVSAFLGEF